MTNQEINENCPGVTSNNAGFSEACRECPGQSFCSKSSPNSATDFSHLVKSRLAAVKKILIVMSGKGGVGKSTLATLLAHHIAADPKKNVGILDIDICGPSIARLTNTVGQSVHQSSSGWSPIAVQENIFAMSSAYLVDSSDTPIIWKGAKKTTLIRRFLTDVDWSDIDYLLIDTPPGTSDEHISLLQLLNEAIGKEKLEIIMISLSDTNSINDCRRQIEFLNKMEFKINGMVENMKYFKCHNCG
ncbi:MAG: Cytosolic Fe-S cluster assembly factor nubp1, partial [Marteilia pararefringens]